MPGLYESEDGPVCYMPESTPYDRMEPVEEQERTAIERVGSIPLVANTWDFVTAYYASAKKTYPSVTPYLEMAEKLTTGAANVALVTTRPVVHKLGPTVNSYANRGLDKLEDVLPMIHDEPEEIYDSAKAAVTSKIDSALSMTEKYVDYYLPPAENEQAQEEKDDDDDDSSDSDSDTSSVVEPELPSPKERLQVISHKVRQRAYNRAMDRFHGVQKRSRETLNRLQFTVDLIQYAKENMDATRTSIASTVASTNSTIRNGVAATHENVANVWQEIKKRSTEGAAELHILDRARDLTGRIQKSCETLLAAAKRVPKFDYLATKIAQTKESIDALAHDLAGKSSLNELSASLLETARTNLAHCRNLFEAVMGMVADYAPNWVAPEFDTDPLEGLFMQDLEVELHLHDNNPAENFFNHAFHRAENGPFRRG